MAKRECYHCKQLIGEAYDLAGAAPVARVPALKARPTAAKKAKTKPKPKKTKR